jgi:hypothetical protein
MTPPERDHRWIDAMVEQVHRSAMAKRMRRDPLGADARALSRCRQAVLTDQMLKGIALSRSLRIDGNSGLLSSERSPIHTASSLAVSRRSGVARSFRPLPMQQMCAPFPSTTSLHLRVTSPDGRDVARPVASGEASGMAHRARLGGFLQQFLSFFDDAFDGLADLALRPLTQQFEYLGKVLHLTLGFLAVIGTLQILSCLRHLRQRLQDLSLREIDILQRIQNSASKLQSASRVEMH